MGHFLQSEGIVSLCPIYAAFCPVDPLASLENTMGQRKIKYLIILGKRSCSFITGVLAFIAALFVALVEVCPINRFFFLFNSLFVFEVNEIKEFLLM